MHGKTLAEMQRNTHYFSKVDLCTMKYTIFKDVFKCTEHNKGMWSSLNTFLHKKKPCPILKMSFAAFCTFSREKHSFSVFRCNHPIHSLMY